MLASVRTAAVFGIEAVAVSVEVDVSFGLPGLVMVGLPDAAVRESRDRVRSAIRNSGFAFPQHRVTVNLAPADVRKAGAAFDLPIALGVLAATGIVTTRAITTRCSSASSPSTDRCSRRAASCRLPPARGAVAARLLLPLANAAEASIVEGLRVLPVNSLQEAVDVLNHAVEPRAVERPQRETPSADEPDLADVQGQALGRRALEVAAAGGHNLLLVGPPGAGKTMLARRLPGLLPPLTFDESLEVTTVHSVAGLLPAGRGLIATRPFRAPHHTVSEAALVGGGSLPRPGEISLAHHGVLFLDEMPEFSRRALEVLRQPIEHGTVTIARAARTAVFPSAFMLVGGDESLSLRALRRSTPRVPVCAIGGAPLRQPVIRPAQRPHRSDRARRCSACVRSRACRARRTERRGPSPRARRAKPSDRASARQAEARLAAGQLRGADFGVTNAARSQALAAAGRCI